MAEVIDDLRRYNRFMLIENDRGQVASFTPRFETAAGSWAQRAPEVVWDALWAIWRIKHSGQTEMYHWNLDVPGHAWVLEQMADQKLAVVEVPLTLDDTDNGASYTSPAPPSGSGGLLASTSLGRSGTVGA